jgi:DNA replication and repair protein RecF
VYIKRVKLKNFRCFADRQFEFGDQLTLIEGNNGSGKTSLLEALYYGCYLQSFRTSTSKELIYHDQDYFFNLLEVNLDNFSALDQIQIGYSLHDGKIVKLNEKPILSYKELISCYRIISLTTDDLHLVQGSPEGRREFLNYSLLLEDPSLLVHFKQYKHVLAQRNSLLLNWHLSQQSTSFHDQLLVWTKKVWEISQLIQKKRCEYLVHLQNEVSKLLIKFFPQEDEFSINFSYHAKNQNGEENFDDFWFSYKKKIQQQELQWKRSLFGVHLDDFSIIFQSKKARAFASRGQQKLLLFLIKVAQLELIGASGKPGVFLVDDFLTDLDALKIERAFSMVMNLKAQIIMTSPLANHYTRNFQGSNYCLIEL